MGQSLDPGGPNKLGSATCPQEVDWRETYQQKAEKGRLFDVATLGRVTEVNCITAPPPVHLWGPDLWFMLVGGNRYTELSRS